MECGANFELKNDKIKYLQSIKSVLSFLIGNVILAMMILYNLDSSSDSKFLPSFHEVLWNFSKLTN